jgi:hypothetical protein
LEDRDAFAEHERSGDVSHCSSVSVAVRRDWREVYEFVRRPENFARWVSSAPHKSCRIEIARNSSFVIWLTD